MPKIELIKESDRTRLQLRGFDLRWFLLVREKLERDAIDAENSEILFRNSHRFVIDDPARTRIIDVLMEKYGLELSGQRFRDQLNIGKCIKLRDDGVRIGDVRKVTGYYSSGVLEEELRPFMIEEQRNQQAPSFINFVDALRASLAISALTGIRSITTEQEDRSKLVALLLPLKSIRPDAREHVVDLIRDTSVARALAGYYTISDQAFDVVIYRGVFGVVEEKMHVDTILKPRLLHHG